MELNKIKKEYVKYLLNKKQNNSIRELEGTIKEVYGIIDMVKNPNFKRVEGWESYIPTWLIKIWSDLDDNIKLLVYCMSCKCVSAYNKGNREGYDEALDDNII